MTADDDYAGPSHLTYVPLIDKFSQAGIVLCIRCERPYVISKLRNERKPRSCPHCGKSISSWWTNHEAQQVYELKEHWPRQYIGRVVIPPSAHTKKGDD